LLNFYAVYYCNRRLHIQLITYSTGFCFVESQLFPFIPFFYTIMLEEQTIADEEKYCSYTKF